MRPICKSCGRITGMDFVLPDAVWQSVVPLDLQNRVLCLECFDRLAANAGVDYSDDLATLYFAGVTNGLEFRQTSQGTVTVDQPICDTCGEYEKDCEGHSTVTVDRELLRGVLEVDAYPRSGWKCIWPGCAGRHLDKNHKTLEVKRPHSCPLEEKAVARLEGE